jgi:hypothetical protein
LRKGGLDLLDILHHIETLMVPVEVHRNDPGGLLPEIFDDREIVIFNPLYSQVYDLGGDAMTLEKVGQSEESHGQEVDPHKMTDRPVIIGHFRDMEKNKIKATHGGIVRCSQVIFQPRLRKNGIGQSPEWIRVGEKRRVRGKFYKWLKRFKSFSFL